MPETLTNAQCDEFRRLPVSFNDMLRAVHAHGQGLGGPPPGAADRMLHATLSTLGAIDHALGIGADGCGDPEQTLEAIAALQAQKDGAYLERNRCVALLARMALAMGLRAGLAKTAIEGWSPDWHGCVYIDLPTGQASWHYHDSQAELFAGLPEYAAPWDGHDTPTKYERLAAAFPVRGATLTAAERFLLMSRPLTLADYGQTVSLAELAEVAALVELHTVMEDKTGRILPRPTASAYKDQPTTQTP